MEGSTLGFVFLESKGAGSLILKGSLSSVEFERSIALKSEGCRLRISQFHL